MTVAPHEGLRSDSFQCGIGTESSSIPTSDNSLAFETNTAMNLSSHPHFACHDVMAAHEASSRFAPRIKKKLSRQNINPRQVEASYDPQRV